MHPALFEPVNRIHYIQSAQKEKGVLPVDAPQGGIFFESAVLNIFTVFSADCLRLNPITLPGSDTRLI